MTPDSDQLVGASAVQMQPIMVVEQSMQRVAVGQPRMLVLRDAPVDPRPILVDPGRTMLVVEPEARPQMVLAGFTGPQGRPGGGSAPVVTLPVGDVVQGNRVVRSADGTVFGVDLANAGDAGQVIGIAKQSVTAIGASVDVQTAGVMQDSAWRWAPGVLWCGADGALTQTPETSGWLMRVARVVSPTQIDIDIDEPIYRS